MAGQRYSSTGAREVYLANLERRTRDEERRGKN